MWIMIAGPYTSGGASPEERARRLRTMNEHAHHVFLKGHVPVIGVNLALPIVQAAEGDSFDALMMPISLALAERCDAVLRIGGESAGADDEVAVIAGRGGTVYRFVDDIPTS